MQFNVRYGPEITAEAIQARIEKWLAPYALTYALEWHCSAEPFLTAPDARLIEAAEKAVHDITGMTPERSAAGGTSDGRYFAPTGCEVVELGALNATAHQANECIALASLEALARIYQSVLSRML